MAGPGAAFHVTFGINETALTRALEEQQYDLAVRIICDNSYTTFLDEGCYQRTPLYLCLCGVGEGGKTPLPRNLQVACLLAQSGAAVNYRVPTTYYGSEYIGPGRSSLELVVDLYNALTMHPCHGVTPHSTERECIVGMLGERLTRTDEIIQQLLDVAFVLLTHGADVGLRDAHRRSVLHRAAVLSADPRMLYLLCENAAAGAIGEARDGKGNSVLGALCDGFPLGVDDFVENHESADDFDPYTQCCHLEGKAVFLDFLLSLPDIDVDARNLRGQSALWLCMVRGDTFSAGKLLQAGCDSSLQGQLRDNTGALRSVSPLFVSLCSPHNIRSRAEKYMANIPTHTHFLAHLVDQGYFSNPAVLLELHAMIDSSEELQEYRQLQFLDEKLVSLLFGGTTSTLRQLCARHIFRRAFLAPGSRALRILVPGMLSAADSGGGGFVLEAFAAPRGFAVYVSELVTDNVVDRLVSCLKLPADTAPYFLLELFRLRLGASLRRCSWFHYHHPPSKLRWGFFDDDDDSDNSDWDDEDGSSGVNDSDLEYW